MEAYGFIMQIMPSLWLHSKAIRDQSQMLYSLKTEKKYSPLVKMQSLESGTHSLPNAFIKSQV